jgi:hypothetical protein
MRRFLPAAFIVIALLYLPAGAGAGDTLLLAQEPAVEAPADLLPDERPESERIAETEAAIEGEAWTFRFLVPSALVLSVIVIVVALIWYGVRILAPYRVAK